ncbi:MAG: hypothetical protein HYR74_09060 [Candidatus Eisenbacteria bacterium]|nr:hypothetical protein [Candidatus Eisenbacteria bacterium]
MNAVPQNPDTERITRLERQVRWLSSLATLLALAFAALIAWQFYPRTQPITATGFILRDAQGRRRAELGMRPDGGPMLRLDNTEERARAMLFMRPDGSVGLRLGDGRGVSRAELSVNDRGRPELSVSDADGRLLGTFGAGPDSSGAIRLNDAQRRRLWTAP